MIWTTSGNLGALKADAGFDFGVAKLPAKLRRGSPTGGGNLYLFAKRPQAQREAALLLARWLVTPERTAQWGHDSGYIAVRPAAWETPLLKKQVAEFPAATVARDQLHDAVAELSTHENQRVTRVLNGAIVAALEGGETPQQALDRRAGRCRAHPPAVPALKALWRDAWMGEPSARRVRGAGLGCSALTRTLRQATSASPARRTLVKAALGAAACAPWSAFAQAPAAHAVSDGAGRKVPVPRPRSARLSRGVRRRRSSSTRSPPTCCSGRWRAHLRRGTRVPVAGCRGAGPRSAASPAAATRPTSKSALALKPDLILDFGLTCARATPYSPTRAQLQIGVPYALLDGRFERIPAELPLRWENGWDEGTAPVTGRATPKKPHEHRAGPLPYSLGWGSAARASTTRAARQACKPDLAAPSTSR